MSFVYINSAIITSYAIYHHTESDRPGTSFNVKINNLLVSRSFILSGGELLNNKKLKLVCSNNVWGWFEIDSSQLNSLLRILLGSNGINPAPFHSAFRFLVEKIFARALIYIFIQEMREMRFELY